MSLAGLARPLPWSGQDELLSRQRRRPPWLYLWQGQCLYPGPDPADATEPSAFSTVSDPSAPLDSANRSPLPPESATAPCETAAPSCAASPLPVESADAVTGGLPCSISSVSSMTCKSWSYEGGMDEVLMGTFRQEMDTTGVAGHGTGQGREAPVSRQGPPILRAE